MLVSHHAVCPTSAIQARNGRTTQHTTNALEKRLQGILDDGESRWKRKQGKRYPGGKLVPECASSKAMTVQKNASAIMATHATTALGRAYVKNLLGTGTEAEARYTAAKRFMRIAERLFPGSDTVALLIHHRAAEFQHPKITTTAICMTSNGSWIGVRRLKQPGYGQR